MMTRGLAEVDVPSADTLRRPRGLTPHGQLGPRARRRRHALQQQWRVRMRRIEQEPAEPRVLPRWSPAVVAAPMALLAAGCGVELAASPALLVALLSALAVLGLGEVLREPVGDLTDQARPYWVVYQRQPAWKVGESSEEAWARRKAGMTVDDPQRHPGDYAGRIVNVIDGTQRRPPWATGEMFDAQLMDLTAAQCVQANSHRAKVAVGELVPITIQDRLGAATAALTARYSDDDLAAAWDGPPSTEVNPEKREGHNVVSEAIKAAARALPRTVAHTGTGLYCVKASPNHNDDTQSGAPAGQVITLTTGGLGTADAWKGGYVVNATRSETRAIVSHADATVTLEGDLSSWADTDDLDIYDAWSTNQGAFDQLYTDQGSTAFSANQYVRTYTGSYTETVAPNSGLYPDYRYHYSLIWEGQTGTASDVTITPPAAAALIVLTLEQVAVRNMTIVGDNVNSGGTIVTGGAYMATFDNVAVSGTVADFFDGINVSGMKGVVFRDCTLYFNQSVGGGAAAVMRISTGGFLAERTAFTRAGGHYYHIQLQAGNSSVFRACTFVTCSPHSAHPSTLPGYAGSVIYENCSFYESYIGVNIGSNGTVEIRNCAWEGAGTYSAIVFWRSWPDETASQLGTVVHLTNSIFYNYSGSGVAYCSLLAEYKTYAQVAALSQVTASGCLDATDPLFTDAANGDFSLQAASPCRRRGVGCGAIEGINGVEFSSTTPDIGAWSSGSDPAPAPTLQSAVNDGTGTSATLTYVAGQAAQTIYTYYRALPSVDWTLSGTTLSGSGSVQITGLLPNTTYEFMGVASWSGSATVGQSGPSAARKVRVSDGSTLFEDVQDALWDWVDGQSAESVTTIWMPSNAPMPAVPFVCLRMRPLRDIGQDHHGDLSDEGIATIYSDREFVLEVEVYGDLHPDGTDEALSLVETIKRSLQVPSIVDTLQAAGIAPRGAGPTQDLSAIGRSDYEARYLFEATFGLSLETSVDLGLIETVESPMAEFD